MDFDFEKMMQMMDLVNMFQSQPAAEASSRPEPEAVRGKARPGRFNYESLRFYDNDIHTPSLKAMKAAIPYLDERYQRSVGIMVKVLEIQMLMEMYGSRMAATAAGPDTDWRRGMLKAIRPYTDERRCDMVDMLLKLMELRQIITKMEVLHGH